MITKICTDIDQSKKLVEILSIESADMYYQYALPKSDKIRYNPILGNPIDALEWYNKGYTHFGKNPLTLNEYCIPCWSLAALFSYLHEIDCFPNIEVDEHKVTMSVFYYDDDEVGIIHPVHDIRVKADTFIDACYKLILKLHEQKVL